MTTTEQKSVSPRAWAELLTLGLLWGGSFFAIRIALDEIGPMTVVLHRTGWAMLVLWVVVLLRGLPVPRSPRIWAAFLVMGCLNNVIPFSLMAWGQLHIESGLTSIFNAATAIFGVLLAALFFADERLTLRKGVGVALGFAGVCVAIGIEALMQFDIRSAAQIAVLAGALSYGFASVWGRARLGALPPMVSAAGMLTGSTLLMIPLVLLTEGVPPLVMEARTWGAIAYFSLAATALAYLIYWRVLAMAGSGNLMLVTLVIPPIAILLGAWGLGETLLPQAYAGFALLALGLVVIDGRLLRRLT
ncbi:DMT family transporter [Pseudaestuariivita atlantica]|uniref:Multidrug transporter n=1 Tax=Pseudaestuariivita atlantica TaxID=1317121 RepID=A0A0L1JVY3_9RHOB|nr:DMT family transporter [Pseudaestuariivita atlantica]KNG95553.1 multidrug transporter [Pseudaestuariivita atlantica]